MSSVKQTASDTSHLPPSTSAGVTTASDSEKRWKDLYTSIDVNSDGKIDIEELSKALKQYGRPEHVESVIKRLFRRKEKPSYDCSLDFREFVDYIKKHESDLAIVFSHIDLNKDGVVDPVEIKNYMHSLGIDVSLSEAEKIFQKMKHSSDGVVNLDAFQEYLLLHPSSDPLDIVRFWQHSLIVDVGEDTLVPENFDLSHFSRNTWWRHFVAGAIAGTISRTLTAPLDRLKIFLQVHANHTNKYGPISGLKTLLLEGGVMSMWRGNGINVLKIAPETALRFTFYEKAKCFIKKDRQDDLNIFERIFAGSIAGATAQSLIYPAEVMKVRFALRKTHEFNKGILDTARQIYRVEGAKAFYRGYVPNLLGIMPYAGIDLAVYETLKKLYLKHTKKEDPSVFVSLVCGSLSAVCGQITSYPFALVKTKLQSNVESKLAGHPTDMLGQFRFILQNEGFFGLYRGLSPGVVKIIPAVSTSYVIYEYTRKRLGANMS